MKSGHTSHVYVHTLKLIPCKKKEEEEEEEAS
jgi:hypothetical protein